jgi:hypothetical protein
MTLRKRLAVAVAILGFLGVSCGLPLVAFLAVFHASPEFAWFVNFFSPVSINQGTLVAGIGMPLDEVRRRSTFELGDAKPSLEWARHSRGPRGILGGVLFDFELMGTGMGFCRCRFFSVTLQEASGVERVDGIVLIASKDSLTWRGIKDVLHDTQGRLKAAGWTADSSPTGTAETLLERVSQGSAPAEATPSFAWTKGNTRVSFRALSQGDRFIPINEFDQEVQISPIR